MSGKELREWATTVTSVITPVMLVAGGVVFKNQRLEIEATVRNAYVLKTDWEPARATLERGTQEAARGVAETNSKLDSLNVKMAQVGQSLTDLKEHLAVRPPGSGRGEPN